MQTPEAQRSSHCPACGMAAAGDGPACIFCGAGLITQCVREWRAVYHPHSYADAMLATAALQANGVTTRLQQCNLSRVLFGQAGGVVQVAADEHPLAREVLRQVRGVRTDTEYLEWQAIKRRAGRNAPIVAALAAGAVLAAGILFHFVREGVAEPAPSRQAGR